jgi:hypothetical protein
MSLLDALLLDPAPFDVWIAARTDGIKGSGTISDPWDGSTQTKFDGVMQTIAAQFPNQKVAIHLGPGTFTTAGFADGASNPWEIEAGMKILGSGREATILKRAAGGNSGYVLGHNLANAADFFELCDVTLDCNLTSSPSGGATCGAVRVLGNQVRLARVRAKNWGCSLSGGTCYVFAVITANPSSVAGVSNCGMEGCVADAPAKLSGSPANAGTVVMFHVGAIDPAGVQQEDYARSPYIRNCFGQWDTSITGSQARGLSMNWCRGGVLEGNHIYDADYGGPYPGSGTTLDLIVRNNFLKNVQHGMNWPLGGLNPSTPTALSSLARDLTFDSTGKTALATASGAHGLQRGERVKIDASAGTPGQFKGVFMVSGVPATNQFRYQMISDPGSTSPTSPTMQKVFSAGRLIIEGNVIELRQGVSSQRAVLASDNASTAPVYDYVYGDVIVRNNKIRYVDGAAPNDSGATLIELKGAKNVMVQYNVLDTIATTPLVNQRCGNATYFNNKTPGGVLVQGWNSDTSRKYDELESEAEDAFVMAMFNEK